MTQDSPIEELEKKAYDNGDEVWESHREKILSKHGLNNDDND